MKAERNTRRTTAQRLAVAVILAGMLASTGAIEGADAALAPQSSAPVNSAAPTVRIKDITRVQGVRDNQLVGLGLVVGLAGTGDGTGSQANIQMVANMLQQFGVLVDPQYLRLRNVAAVMVTATLPAFARTGDTIDATVSSLGDARSLQGGILLQTPLQGADGQVYAVAQGALAVGGQSAPAGGIVQRTQPLTAVLPNAAIVEKEVSTTFVQGNTVLLVLDTPDFTTANRVAQAINAAIGPNTATALDQSGIQVAMPPRSLMGPVEFLAVIEELPVAPDAPARVVINERTGTVIIGATVRIAPVAVTHGNLSVQIGGATSAQAGRAGAVAGADGSSGQQSMLMGGSTVEDVIKGLNALGATPKDIISLLLAIKAAGALYGELVVI